jgi:predicted amidohydrolase
MNSKIKIGTWQGPVADNDFHKNLQKVKSVLEESRHSELDFLCFPETYLSGYSARAIQESACSLDHPEITRFIDESKKYDTVILVGMSEKVKDQIYNSQLVGRYTAYRPILCANYHRGLAKSSDCGRCACLREGKTELPLAQ